MKLLFAMQDMSKWSGGGTRLSPLRLRDGEVESSAQNRQSIYLNSELQLCMRYHKFM